MLFATSYFTNVKNAATNTQFHTDRQAEDEISNAVPFSPSELAQIDRKYGEFQSNYGTILHCSVNIHLDTSYSMDRLGHFMTITCSLGCLIAHKLMCYLKSHPNKH